MQQFKVPTHFTSIMWLGMCHVGWACDAQSVALCTAMSEYHCCDTKVLKGIW